MASRDDRSPSISASEIEEDDDVGSFKQEPELDQQIDFQIVVGGSLRGKCLLKDSRGYTYTLKTEKGDKSWWRCSKRNKNFRCGASVSQVGDTFTIGRYPHEHAPDPEREPTPKTKKRRELKKAFEQEVANMVTDMYNECSDDDGSGGGGDSASPLKIQSPAPKKIKTVTNNRIEGDPQQTLIRIEKERLLIDNQRLKIERERLEVAKDILEEIRNHNCRCVTPAMNQIVL